MKSSPTLKKYEQEELKKIVDKFDKRHAFYQKLEQWKFNYGEIPTKYLPDWTAWLDDNKTYWKKIPGIYRRMRLAAKKNAKNRLLKEAKASEKFN